MYLKMLQNCLYSKYKLSSYHKLTSRPQEYNLECEGSCVTVSLASPSQMIIIHIYIYIYNPCPRSKPLYQSESTDLDILEWIEWLDIKSNNHRSLIITDHLLKTCWAGDKCWGSWEIWDSQGNAYNSLQGTAYEKKLSIELCTPGAKYVSSSTCNYSYNWLRLSILQRSSSLH